MKHYIDKSALVVEIKRRIKEHHSGYLVCLKDILSSLNTLEVKEVDLEKEIDTIVDAIPCRREHIEFIAKHFFELGLKVKGE